MDASGIDNRIKGLCEELSRETDKARMKYLQEELREVIVSEHENCCLRLAFIAMHYRRRLQELECPTGRTRVPDPHEHFRDDSQSLQLKVALRLLGLGQNVKLTNEAR